MVEKKKVLEYEAVTVYNPGGEQLVVPLSRKRLGNFINLCAGGIIAVHPNRSEVLSREEIIADLDVALMLAPLFPRRVEEAMKQSFTKRQSDKVREALHQGQVIKFIIK